MITTWMATRCPPRWSTVPPNGSVVLNSDGSFVYSPERDFNGIDTFNYKVSDGTSETLATTVTITVAQCERCSGGSARCVLDAGRHHVDSSRSGSAGQRQ